ncbi:uncharacterized protein LOC116169101 [Photinus pyralis]|uniref:Uncharacterized protein n=1 Tax=Photinus pyralis TaxID=7054 RepID=A0A1Y1M2H4_PHOPY|nr:uncharacterized protein LOC116169101 [Photinus pyralis]
MNCVIVIVTSMFFNVIHMLPTEFVAHKVFKRGLLPERLPGREEAFFEIEKPSLYNSAQVIASNIIKPTPIVDTISEADKYGNTGEQFKPVGNLITGSFQKISRVINAVVDTPTTKTVQLGRSLNEYLSTIGAKVVGLI